MMQRERERGLSTDYGTQSGLDCVGVRRFKLWGLECVYFSALWGPPQGDKISVISGTRILQVARLLKSKRNPMSVCDVF